MLGLATCVSSGVHHPIDQDLPMGTPDFHPIDQDPSMGTPDSHPGLRPRNYRINPKTEVRNERLICGISVRASTAEGESLAANGIPQSYLPLAAG
jgi:hypothetical protein